MTAPLDSAKKKRSITCCCCIYLLVAVHCDWDWCHWQRALTFLTVVRSVAAAKANCSDSSKYEDQKREKTHSWQLMNKLPSWTGSIDWYFFIAASEEDVCCCCSKGMKSYGRSPLTWTGGDEGWRSNNGWWLQRQKKMSSLPVEEQAKDDDVDFSVIALDK